MEHLKPGDIVVCIDNKGVEGQLQEGKLYKITDVNGDYCAVNVNTYAEFFTRRFKISRSHMFKEILNRLYED